MTIQAEHEWILKHPSEMEKFSGKWVAVLGGKIVATGSSYEDVWGKVKTSSIEKMPIVTYILKPGEEQFIA